MKKEVVTKFQFNIRLTRLRFVVRNILGCYPKLFFPIYNLKSKNRTLTVKKNSEIVIEGFPRSANTYAFVAFELAQKRSVKIAHHMHVPAQVIKAVKLELPTIVLIRTPADAISSLVVAMPELPIRRVILSYINFYREIQECIDKCVIANFEDIINCYAEVIHVVNHIYCTNFMPYNKTEHTEVTIFNQIDSHNRSGLETDVARPSTIKEELKQRIKTQLAYPRNASLLQEADRIYKLFYSHRAIK